MQTATSAAVTAQLVLQEVVCSTTAAPPAAVTTLTIAVTPLAALPLQQQAKLLAG
jgi:hypothetical protein